MHPFSSYCSGEWAPRTRVCIVTARIAPAVSRTAAVRMTLACMNCIGSNSDQAERRPSSCLHAVRPNVVQSFPTNA